MAVSLSFVHCMRVSVLFLEIDKRYTTVSFLYDATETTKQCNKTSLQQQHQQQHGTAL